MDHPHIDVLRLADEAEIQHAFDVAVRILLRACQLARTDHAAILAAHADGKRAGTGDQAGDLFVDGAGQHHLDNLHHRRIGDAQPIHERGLDSEALQHRIDLRATAMDDDGVHAHLLQQRDVAAEVLGQVLLAHRMAAVLHHDRRAGVTAQKRQRLRQHAGPFGGGFDGR